MKHINSISAYLIFISLLVPPSLSQTTIHNPIISGFNPDPSICRVGEDFYLVTSSFEYFPGVPIYTSKDLVNWKLIGHCLTRKSQLDLDSCRPSSGIFAPTIRYHNGMYYMITTNRHREFNFYVTATDPSGPWSDPIVVDSAMFDPSLFFDTDGRVYYTRRGNWETGGTLQAQIDPLTGRFLSQPRLIHKGHISTDQEGPHLYNINGWYYLLTAEGGTRSAHMETVGSSKSPWGPFDSSPFNPMIANHWLSNDSVRAAGHADLVQDAQGNWWVVFLATRHYRYDAMSHLGRETFLMPVIWKDGWPVGKISRRGTLTIEAATPPPKPFPQEPVRDDFNSDTLGLNWNFIRNPVDSAWSLTERKGFLRLHGLEYSLNSFLTPSWIGRRQQHMQCAVSTLVEFDPDSASEAGLTVWHNFRYHYDLALALRDGKPAVILRKTIGDMSYEDRVLEVPPGKMVLSMKSYFNRYEFYCTDEQGVTNLVGGAMTQFLGSEVIGSLTGVFIGLYTCGPENPTADFDWFDYWPIEK